MEYGGSVLSRSEVRELAERHGLGGDWRLLTDLPRATWRLEPDLGVDGAAAWAFKIGGGADLAEDERWPVNASGVPYTLLAQIDCARLPDLGDGWPRTAWRHDEMLLRVFADCAHVDGTEVVVLAAAPGTAVARQERPSLPEPWPMDLPPQDFGLGENALVGETPVRAVPVLSVPVLGSSAKRVMDSTGYWDWAMELATDAGAWGNDTTTLLGEPFAIQSDPLESVAYRYSEGSGHPQASDPDRSLSDPGAWRVLLHLSSNEPPAFNYAGGAYTIVVPAAELAEARYDHATCVWQF